MNKLIFITRIYILIAVALTISDQFAEAREREDYIRISAGTAPGIDRVKFSGAGGSESVSTDPNVGFRFDALGVSRFPQEGFDWVLGGGLMIATHSGEDDFGDEADLVAFAGLIQGGIALRFSDAVRIELTPELAGGFARQDITGFSAGSGPYLMYGFRTGLHYQVDRSFEFGLDLGYSGFISPGEVRTGFGDVDVDFTGHGPRVAGTFAFRF